MILGINLKKIDARVEDVEKIMAKHGKEIGIRINTPTISITNAEAKDLSMMGMKNIISISFKFESSYEPDIGGVKIEGEVLFKDDDSKTIVDEWKKNKKLSEKVAIPLLNAIYKKCLIKAMNETEDLQLPPPMVLPSISAPMEKDGKKK